MESKKNKNVSFYASRGFTLLELLVVVAIIGILTTIVIFAINDAKRKGADASVKSNLGGARSQAEVYYNTNTSYPNTYTGVCDVGSASGAEGIGNAVNAAAKSVGIPANLVAVNSDGQLGQATCRENGVAWAVEVPLKSFSDSFWCIDSTGQAMKSSTTLGSGYVCNP